jgi:hypothetical protein
MIHLAEIAAGLFKDAPDNHTATVKMLEQHLKSSPQLAAHRKWIVDNKYGFGEDAFHAVWDAVATTLPDGFSFLEVGVHRGQSLSAVDLAATLQGKKCTVYGLSPFNGADGNYYEKRDNYDDDVLNLFSLFNDNRRPVLIRGYSTDTKAKEEVSLLAPFDVVYLDACHEFEDATHDINYYAPLVKVGGYFLSDDSATDLNLPDSYFKGFEGSTKACNNYFNNNEKWVYVANVVHLRIYHRV